jgi:hypothetical protein
LRVSDRNINSTHSLAHGSRRLAACSAP